MQNKEEQKRYIYLKAEKKWVEVSEEYYKEHIRFYDTFRKRQQSHGQCVCPKSKFWLCDGDCCNCEFQSVGDTLSLDYITENDDEMGCSHMELITDNTPSVESIEEEKIELEHLFARLNELMPEAVKIGELRQKGLSDEKIADNIGIKRTTFLSRIKKIKELLKSEYPDLF